MMEWTMTGFLTDITASRMEWYQLKVMIIQEGLTKAEVGKKTDYLKTFSI